MAAPKNNKFWEARSSHGRNPKFADPSQLWDACLEYFNWCEENPLYAEKTFCYQGEVVTHKEPRMRAMTISGLCLFLDICENTWASYRKKEDFLSVTTQAEKYIYNQKFSGAAAEMLNANIIARDLGLKDKVEQSGDPANPMKHDHTWNVNVVTPKSKD